MGFSVSGLTSQVKNAIGSANSKIKEVTDKVFKSPVSTFKFADVRTLDRPAPAWRWTVQLPTIKGLSIPALHCESVDLVPGLNIPKVSKYFQGIELPFPGVPSYDTVSAVFYENESYQTLNYFSAWTNLIFDPASKTYGVPKSGRTTVGYGQDVMFSLLPATETAVTKRYANVSLGLCWPSNIQRLSYGSTTERIKIQVDFVFHSLDLQIVGQPAPGRGGDVASLLNKFMSFRR